MGKPIARQFDIVLGTDIHMFFPPGSPSPVPGPFPFVGMLFDPNDLSSKSKATVFIQGIPRAIAGTVGIATIPHLPIPGPFAPPLPTNDCELQQGSDIVTINGDAAGYSMLPVLSCTSSGKPPPIRRWKKTTLKGLYSATSFVTTTSTNVFVGGSPVVHGA